MGCVCDDGTLYSGGETIPCFYCGTQEYNDMFDESIHVSSFLVFSLNNLLRIGVLIERLPKYTLKLAYYEGNTKHTIEVKDSETIVISREQFLRTKESKHMLKLHTKLYQRIINNA